MTVPPSGLKSTLELSIRGGSLRSALGQAGRSRLQPSNFPAWIGRDELRSSAGRASALSCWVCGPCRPCCRVSHLRGVQTDRSIGHGEFCQGCDSYTWRSTTRCGTRLCHQSGSSAHRESRVTLAAQTMMPVMLNTGTGWVMPFNVISPRGSACTASSMRDSVFWLVMICPPFASLHSRAARLVTPPMQA
jgi:hypothetical protein